MTRLRSLIGPLTAAWLLCQGIGLAAPPVLLWMALPAAIAECTCAHGDHAICPMHHRRVPATRCSMGPSDNGDTAILSSMLTGNGILTPVVVAAVPITASAPVRLEIRVASLRPAAPDPPPPRA